MWAEIRANLPAYPSVKSAAGEVWLDVPGAAGVKVQVVAARKPVPVRSADGVIEFATAAGERYRVEKTR